jgi:hypothetical protein
VGEGGGHEELQPHGGSVLRDVADNLRDPKDGDEHKQKIVERLDQHDDQVSDETEGTNYVETPRYPDSIVCSSDPTKSEPGAGTRSIGETPSR